MERIRSLGRYQKRILLFMIAMVLLFTVLYPMTIAKKGFAYENVILIPNQENGNTVYSGKIQGKPAIFTVYADKTVVFRYGDKSYGPYTAKEDPTAIPRDYVMRGNMTGVELSQGEEIIFRGGILDNGEYRLLCKEDGSFEDLDLSKAAADGIVIDENGDVIDPMKPSVSAILALMIDPELTHKGKWSAWFGGLLLCLVTAFYILYAEELFRWNLSFRIRNVDQAEASDWEIPNRYIAWLVLLIAAMLVFIFGLF